MLHLDIPEQLFYFIYFFISEQMRITLAMKGFDIETIQDGRDSEDISDGIENCLSGSPFSEITSGCISILDRLEFKKYLLSS